MKEAFDPYYKWLGIPPREQPPNHYRLLGVELFESDADVIESAADQRVAHLRKFQSGKNSKSSQELLTAVSSAKIVLLNPAKRKKYDAELNAALTPDDPLAPLPEATSVFQPTPTPFETAQQFGASGTTRPTARFKAKPNVARWLLPAALVGGSLVLMLGLGVVLLASGFFSSPDDPIAQRDDGDPPPPVVTPDQPDPPVLKPKPPLIDPTPEPKPPEPKTPEPEPPLVDPFDPKPKPPVEPTPKQPMS